MVPVSLLRKTPRFPWVSRLGAFLIWLLGGLLRWRVEDGAGIFLRELRAPVIFAFWHETIGIMPYVYARFLAPRRVAVLISPSGDGQLVAEISERFGLETVRGSSSKRPVAALLEALRAAQRERKSLGITPDGPRGPRHGVQPGVLELAKRTGAPIVPIRCEFLLAWRLKSWDRFAIPLPLSRCRLTFGPKIELPPTPTPEQWQKAQAQLAQALTSGGAAA